MRKKGDLPVKDCLHCLRPMVWRKAWARNWEDVKYCSDRCQREAKAARGAEGRSGRTWANGPATERCEPRGVAGRGDEKNLQSPKPTGG
jgi:hypothetical protein